MPLTGVSGIGKTITLLEFLRVNFVNYQHCYFHIKDLTKKSNIEKLAVEIVKLFNKKQFLKNYIELVRKIESTRNLSIWDKIIMILDYIIEMNNKFIKEQKIIIVFDQYKLGFDSNQTLFNIIKEEKYVSHIKFIICSSINEKDVKSNITYSVINKKYILKNILGYEYLSNLCSAEKKIKNKKIKSLMEEFNFLTSYYFQFISKYHRDESKFRSEKSLDFAIQEFLLFQLHDVLRYQS